MHFIICSSAKKFQTHHSCDCKTKKLTVSSLKGVAYLFCRHYVPVWFNTTISLEVTKMLYLFWTDQPQPNCQTWCVLRLGTTGCVHLCVSLRLEIRFGFKSAQICGLLPLLHRGSLSLAPGAMQQWVFSKREINYCFLIYVLELLLYGSSDSVVRVPF